MTPVTRPDAAPTTGSGLPLERLRSARLSVFVAFALAGLVFASWASRIADAKASLGLSAGELGMTLFAASVGSITGLPLAGRITDRIGAGFTLKVEIVAPSSASSSMPGAPGSPSPGGCSSSGSASASGTSR